MTDRFAIETELSLITVISDIQNYFYVCQTQLNVVLPRTTIEKVIETKAAA